VTRVKLSRPHTVLLGLAVAGLLLTGCGPTDNTAAPAVAPPTTAATADLTTAAADPLATTDPTTAAAQQTTEPPATSPAKPAATRKPSPKPTTHKPAPKPTTKKPAPKPTTKAPAGFVHPGAFCSPEGAFGKTSKGTLMRCTFKSGDIRARWRAA
jgi:outer membrane biosynthesis protein TonB